MPIHNNTGGDVASDNDCGAVSRRRKPGPGDLPTRRRLLIWGTAVSAVVCAGVLWWFWPSPGFEAQHIDPELPALGEPMAGARVMWYLDGGSISVELFRTNGEVTTCFLQVSKPSEPKWRKIFIGTDLNGKDLGRELSFPDDHRAYLIRMIDQYAPRDEMKIQALVSLRGAARDYLAGYLYGRGW